MGGPPIPAALPAIAPENPPNDATAQSSKESLSTTPAARSGYAPHIPLSARRDEPLDFSNISTKSQLKVARRDATKIRPYGLQEAPTFRPTEEDFQNPMQYIQKIRSEGSRYGIIKIVPPASWDPPFAIDTKRFHFRTRKQELNSVEGGTRTNLNYMDQLAKFHKQRGYNLNRFPSVDKRPLDLYKLKKAVESRGGFERVCKHKKWAEIGRDLGYSGKIMSSLSTSLKNSYSKWLQPYEEFLAYAKPGVQQQLEHEQGGPFTPPPGVSPMGQPPLGTPMPYHSTPPAYHTSSALHAHINGYEKSPNAPIPKSESSPKLEPPPPPKQAPPPGPVSSGFTPVNPGGFTAVNMTPASFHTAGMPQQMEARGPPPLNILPPQINGTHVQSLPPAPNFLPTSQPVPNAFHHGGYPNPLKRAISHDGMNGFPSNDVRQPGLDDDDEGRRSKRVKKAAPTVVGSHMSTLKPSTPKVIMKPKQHPTKPGEVCEACGKSEDRPTFLICDSCDCGYHGQCLDPPVQAPHPFEWHCPRCLVGTGEFGFEEGGTYSLRQFREKADTFKNTYFSQTRPPDTEPKEKPLVSEEDVEKEFWRLVESVTEVVEVEYGADIHSTTHGSGFPTVERNPLDPYSHDWWNLNILPLHHDSLFRHIKTDISGMTVPWLYVGMCFSTFCWHNEDHYAYSANFQHFGDTKTWYGIPGEDAERFEQAMKAAVPELFESQPDLLFQLVTLLPPDQLKKAGVNVYALDQRAGEIVITFPQAYHAGFNHGFNFNEAVNFAPFDWEPFGAAGVERLQEFRKSPCFSHDELLMTAASSRDTSIKTAKWLAPALERMRDHELSQRNGFLERHHKARLHHCPIDERGDANEICSLNFRVDDQDASEAEQQCSFCKCYTFLSRFQCHKTSQTMCLSHAGVHKCCEGTEEQILTDPDHTLIYRMTDSLLSSSVQKISEKARAPEVWNEKLEQVLDNEPKPALKALRTLVNEGERIPWKLDRLDDLKSFVDRCNRWVEEALSYTVRKQQNRRKNDRVWKKGKNDKGDKGADAGEREREHRKVENIHRLLAEASEISFDCPEIEHLEDRAKSISDFQSRASDALGRVDLQSVEGLEELMEEGKLFNLDIPELGKLEKILQQMRWNEDARERVKKRQTLEEVLSAIQKGNEIGIPEDNALLKQLQSQKSDGEGWEVKVKELMAAEIVHFPQLEALEGHAEDPKNLLPVSPMTMAEVRRVLSKHKEAREQIKAMYDKSKEPSIRDRPKYKDVRDIIQELADLNSKPQGTLDLEKELRRHEDWMRTGKKLFGKANAPLHILLVHMKYVKEHNDYCFDIHDVPRMPVEPASRSPTPDPENSDIIDGGASKKETFCICRRSENGVMVECEICHEWYHCKCLKIARGKLKEDDYKCPICDWRAKIPRDAARPKLEELEVWQDEIQNLPFQPDEESVLAEIIDTATNFRQLVKTYINPLLSSSEDIVNNRFYLRKIEGAEVLLAYETNYFRQELHKWAPVAPDPPPVLEQSLSTRKPRPTKQQKLMAEYKVSRPEDLPPQLRTKQHTFPKPRKGSETHGGINHHRIQPAPKRNRSDTPKSTSTSSAGPREQHGFPPHHPLDDRRSSQPTSIHNHFVPSQHPQYSPTYPPGAGPYHPSPHSNLSYGSPDFHPRSPSLQSGGAMSVDPHLFSPTNGNFIANVHDPPITPTNAAPGPYFTGPPSGGSTGLQQVERVFSEFVHDPDAADSELRNEAAEALELTNEYPDPNEIHRLKRRTFPT